MRTALLITAKDLRQRVRDRSAFLYGIVAPLGLALIFSTVFGGLGGSGLDLRFAVVDRDGGHLAATFRDEVLGGVEEAGFAELATTMDEEQARAAVRDGELTAVFVVPEGFTNAVLAARPTGIDVVGNVDAELGTDVARSIAASFLEELRASQIAVGVVAPQLQGADPAAIAARAAATASPVVVGQVGTATRQLDLVTYLSAGMAVFFLFFTVQFGVTSFLEERRDGTLARLLAAPIARASLYGGKALTSFVLGVVSMTVLVIASAYLIGAEWGDPVGVAVLVVAGVLSAVAVMALVATLARTAEQANTWQSIIAVVLGAVGGVFFPIAGDNRLLTWLGLLTPHRWFMRGLGDLAGGADVVAVLPATAALLAFAAVGFAVAGLRMRGEVLA